MDLRDVELSREHSIALIGNGADRFVVKIVRTTKIIQSASEAWLGISGIDLFTGDLRDGSVDLVDGRAKVAALMGGEDK